MTTELLEREQKYEAAFNATIPPLDDLPRVATVSVPKVGTLTAQYYDTDDFRLLGAGITLRHRAGGTDAGWHLKLPAAAGRREIQRLGDSPGEPVPAEPVPGELERLVRAYTRGAALRPVARIETRRRLTILRDASGKSLAEVAADEVAAQTLGTTTTVSRWNEIEVELTGGGPELLRAADKRLRHGGLRPAGYSAKLERALGDGLERPRPRRPGRASPGRNSSAGEVVLAYLDKYTARLKSLDSAVRRDQPDAVHQMRVTTRRLRSTLQAFPDVLPGRGAARLRAELKWLGGVLGGARDNEVLTEQLSTWLASLPAELVMGPAQARLRVHFAPREAQAREAVLAALDSERYVALLDELERFLDEPPRTGQAAQPATDVLPAAVGRSFRRTRRRMRHARRVPAGPARDVALHEVRKAAKRARYAAEAAEPVYGKQARRFARRMKQVQSVLGDHQDAVTARTAAREIGVHAHMAGENAFTFGLLLERANRDAAEYRHQARKAWQRAARRKYRAWLG
ncbi:MAG TPA: CYTH and CHAD domain-containing protein [Trebonia sp.]|jgi:CHAD domain-containing protein|nr:CYTH and CHAD domain-containing protein [Trebonia sp.]